MFDQGPHAVLRRDGVCIVLKTPTDEMPQVEYWGADFGLSPDEAALTQLDAMTLRITPPNEKPDAALASIAAATRRRSVRRPSGT